MFYKYGLQITLHLFSARTASIHNQDLFCIFVETKCPFVMDASPRRIYSLTSELVSSFSAERAPSGFVFADVMKFLRSWPLAALTFRLTFGGTAGTHTLFVLLTSAERMPSALRGISRTQNQMLGNSRVTQPNRSRRASMNSDLA